jgi:hypothetical protein
MCRASLRRRKLSRAAPVLALAQACRPSKPIGGKKKIRLDQATDSQPLIRFKAKGEAEHQKRRD